MPIVFAQPQPVGGFSRLGDMQNRITPRDTLAAAVSMNNALQARYASDAQDASRTGLGYANLYADTGLRTEALGLQRAEISQRAALAQAMVQQRAQADVWTMQQQMTMADQQRLNRDRIAVSELQQLHQKGMLNDDEYYGSVAKLRSGIDVLAMKEQNTKNEMLNNMRQEQAEKIKADKEHRQFLNKWESGELESSMEIVVNPDAESSLQAHMESAYPNLRKGTPEYESAKKREAIEMGMASRFVRFNGKLIPESELRGQGSARGQQQDKDNTYEIMRIAAQDPRVRDGSMSLGDAFKEIESVFDQRKQAQQDRVNPQAAAERNKEMISGKMSALEEQIQSSPDTNDYEKRFALSLIEKQKKLMSLKMTSGVQKQLDDLTKQLSQFLGAIEQRKGMQAVIPANGSVALSRGSQGQIDWQQKAKLIQKASGSEIPIFGQ